MRVQSALSSVAVMVAGSIPFVSGSAVQIPPAVYGNDSRPLAATRAHEVRSTSPATGGSGAFIQVGDLSSGDSPMAFSGNDTMNSEIFTQTYPPNDNGAADCVKAAVQDALQGLIVVDLQNYDLTAGIPFVQTNTVNLNFGCNQVVAELWVNVEDQALFEEWQALALQGNAYTGLASSIANQLTTGPSVQACALAFVGNGGWWGGIIAAIRGVETLGEITTQFTPANWPDDGTVQKCGGGTVTTATYYQLPENTCQVC